MEKHSEKRKGEVFFSNASSEQFKELTFSSKRIGKQAFDGKGNKLNCKNWFPVFVKSSEIQPTKKSLNELRAEWRDHLDSQPGSLN